MQKKKKKKLRNDVITLNEKGRLINNEFEVAETYSHYDIALVDAIISNYENHSSIDQVRKKCSNPKK